MESKTLAAVWNRVTGTTYSITNFATSFGRAIGNHVVLEDSRISKQHAVLLYIDGKFCVQDLGSKNGTVVNGHCIQPYAIVPLNSGDELCIGLTILVFTQSSATDEAYDKTGSVKTVQLSCDTPRITTSAGLVKHSMAAVR